MSAAVLTLNAGSSSLKFAVFTVTSRGAVKTAPEFTGRVERIDEAPTILFTDRDGTTSERALGVNGVTGHAAALDRALAAIDAHLGDLTLVSVGHRIVHGGPAYSEPARLDADTITALERYVPLAPSHQPHNLAAVRAARAAWPGATNVACFDTAFHRTQPRVAELFALPRDYADAGVIRYGFHGLSYEYIAQAAPEVIGEAALGRMVVAHLGHGVSLCALHGGKSVATTMGFTALDGMPMGKRCGAIDPGVLLYLLQNDGLSPDDLSALLYKRSGLYGLSGGLSDDMRALEDSAAPEADEAIAYFTHRCAREIGGLTAALGGLDALVFTAGIGENSARVRADVLTQLRWFGFDLDEAANAANGPQLTRNTSGPSAWVIPTNEELMIARHAVQLAAHASAG